MVTFMVTLCTLITIRKPIPSSIWSSSPGHSVARTILTFMSIGICLGCAINEVLLSISLLALSAVSVFTTLDHAKYAIIALTERILSICLFWKCSEGVLRGCPMCSGTGTWIYGLTVTVHFGVNKASSLTRMALHTTLCFILCKRSMAGLGVKESSNDWQNLPKIL